MTNHLLRDRAPLTDATWKQIDDEASTRLPVALGARKLVDFSGPHGWEYSATNLGRVTGVIDAPEESVIARTRRVLPLVEARADFVLDRDELDAVDRGADDVDYGPLDEAAVRIARVENSAVFNGWDAAGITGIVPASPHTPLVHQGSPQDYDDVITQAIATLKRAGVDGPYALALGPTQWTSVIEANEGGGYPLIRHLRDILGGPVEWVPGLDGVVVLSVRGGDFVLEVGQDLSVGYRDHDAQGVSLYLEESFSFRVNTPEAAIQVVIS
ncbi:family 1 encapsulin nanocompartment shell protein [Humibacter ginsenosidimutans]|uniref:Type 1 encapsulin shell protein n=1 Tax=Humibacter ginsenosidimutans TaxID=2599293 RepID=A0A5B8M5B6_9MICO|nr:family 1 encapsulin nanocompartment shell protein [Humibacter ginsenosidimutans]QDZ15958.1 bacteriocin [Humibacter ginsenosidimutans]